MSFHYSPKVVTNGLLMYLDAGNTKSYIGTGSSWLSLSNVTNSDAILMYTASYSPSNNSMLFNGNYDVVNCGGNGVSGIYNITASITLDVWVKPTTLRNNSFIITKGWGDTFQIQANSTNYQFYVYGPTTSAHGVTSNTVPVINKWYNIVGTFDGANVKIYINGILENTTVYNGPIQTSTSFRLAVGNISHMITSTTYPNQGFIGYISVAKVYNRALISSEVLQNYLALKGRYGL